MKDKFKQAFIQVFCTKIGLMFLCMVLGALCLAFSSNSSIIKNGPEWLNVVGGLFFIYPAIIVIIMFYYGIKNTFFNKKK